MEYPHAFYTLLNYNIIIPGRIPVHTTKDSTINKRTFSHIDSILLTGLCRVYAATLHNVVASVLVQVRETWTFTNDIFRTCLQI